MEEKYLITTENGEVYYSDEFSKNIENSYEDGYITSIIRTSDFSYYEGNSSWEQSMKWSDDDSEEESEEFED
jgi:hypothetical protein